MFLKQLGISGIKVSHLYSLFILVRYMYLHYSLYFPSASSNSRVPPIIYISPIPLSEVIASMASSKDL
jgi:hypothetical protein